MKRQEKFGVIFWVFVLLAAIIGLNGCSKTEPSTAIADTIKEDIKVIEKEIVSVKENLPAQCRNKQLDTQLDTISVQVKNISTKVNSVDVACKTEKEVLTQQISKLHIIIGILFTIGCVLGFLLIKKRLLL